MRKKITTLTLLFFAFFAAKAQVKISDMQETTADPTGAWLPLVLNGQNFKYNAGSFIQQKTITEIRGLSPGTLPADFSYYVTDAGKQGFFKYDNADVSSVDDGAIVLVTTNNKRFKRVIYNNTVSSKWFEIGTNPNALINQLGLTFSQAKAIFDRSGSRVVLTDDANGVAGDFTTRNAAWYALQRAINYCVSSENGKLYIPAGTYNVNKGLLVAPAGTGYVSGFEIIGAVSTYNGNAAHTVINFSNKDNFGIGLHRCKGARIRNLKINGGNQISGTTYDYLENPNMDWIHGCRTTLESPHAGLIVDPLFNVGFGTTSDQYPGFESLYIDPSGFGGSTDIIFENCRVEQFVVGFCFSPHTQPQNGEAMAINNSWVQNCKSGISIGQSQNRSVYVNNLKCWGGVETLFDSSTFGDGMADNSEVDGVQIAGGVRYLCRLSNFFNKGLIIKRMHAESLYSLGGNFSGTTGDLVIEDSWLNINSSIPGSLAVHDPICIFKGSVLKVTNTIMMRYNGQLNPPLQIEARNGVFEKCYFDRLPVNLFQGRIVFKNCDGAGGSFLFGENEIVHGNYPPEICNLKMLCTGNMSWQTMHGLYSAQSTANYSYERKQVEGDNMLSILALSGTFNLTSADQTNLTATLTLSPSSSTFKMIQIGDPLFSSSSLIKDEYNDARAFCIGVVSAKDSNTGIITLGKIAKGVDASTTLTNLSIYRPHYMIPALYTGDATLGSNTITNCLGELSSPVNYIPVGVTITSPYFPRGTYIVSATANTIVLSNESTATVSGIEIVGVDWKGEEYGYIDIYNRKCGYKKGDIIYNTDVINYPTVQKWICSKTGITGTTNPPEFITYFLTINRSFTTDSTIDIDAGKLLSSIIVKPSVALTAFKIGTTAGGSDVLASTALAAGVDRVLIPNAYLRAKTKLYFSGISGTVEIIIPNQ